MYKPQVPSILRTHLLVADTESVNIYKDLYPHWHIYAFIDAIPATPCDNLVLADDLYTRCEVLGITGTQVVEWVDRHRTRLKPGKQDKTCSLSRFGANLCHSG